jgi:hypothetical protein
VALTTALSHMRVDHRRHEFDNSHSEWRELVPQRSGHAFQRSLTRTVDGCRCFGTQRQH